MKNYLSLIKFSHTIFALPFALVGFFLANYLEGKTPDVVVLLCILLCMVFARSAAMAFNRYLDRDIDALNPRTVVREIPAGVISAKSALAFVIVNSLAFIATTWFINFLCFALSPVALLVVLGYSYTKRFTALCHFVLGLGLALAPIGAYLAVTGRFDTLPILYSLVVLLWVSGFDIIYALQDEEFDKSLNLNSVPVWLGRRGALQLSNVLHLICGLVIFYAVWSVNSVPSNSSGEASDFGILHWIGVSVFIGLLIYQHTLVKVNDLSKVNVAFFTTNGVASVIYGSLFILDFFF
ncbi:MAG: UbiA family prenyltransferase [Saprospiraceae bacterium]|nr:UbiA family prenyltransferase [Saprospiraceae bacterium]